MKQKLNLISVPRLIGVVLLVIATLAYQTQGIVQVALLAIAGLILTFTPTMTAIKHWQEFSSSFNIKEMAVLMLYDILFFAALAILIVLFASVVREPYEQLKLVQFGEEGMNLGALTAAISIVESLFTTTIIALIVFWLLIVAAYSFSRGLIWLTLLDRQVQKEFFVKFSLWNLLWCTSGIVFMLFFLSSMNPTIGAYAFIIMFLLYTHLTTVFHYAYTKFRSFGKAFKTAFGTGIGELGKFVHSYCYIFIVYVVLSQVQRFVADSKTVLIISFLIMLIFMAWYRQYMRNILRQLA